MKEWSNHFKKLVTDAKSVTENMAGKVQTITEAIPEIHINAVIRDWIVSLFIKAINACSTEQDRIDAIAWLTIAREILANESLSSVEKMQALYKLISIKRFAQGILQSVTEVFKNYHNSDLPLPMKIAIPVVLGAGAIVGGHSVGIAGFGSAIGVPVLLLIFLGTAGITSVLEAFLSRSEARDYISVIAVMIAKDELLRQANHAMRQAMSAEITAPEQQSYVKEQDKIREMLLAMNPYDFEKHTMSFFQQAGLLAWVTKKSNDTGVDGFARHPNGLIVVQCKRNSSDNGVGRPIIQQFKGVIEENTAWKGYIVTTSYFTDEAIESAAKNQGLVLIGMPELTEWHLQGIKFLDNDSPH